MSSYHIQDSGMAFVDQYILVSLVENGEPVEVPVEHDGTVLLSSIQSQYPQAIGIKFRNPATRAFRAVKLCDNVLYPPSPETGWGDEDLVYIVNTATPVVVTYPTGAKAGDAESSDGSSRKREASNEPIELSKQNAKRILSSICSDLIVLNLPYTFSDEDLKQKFEEFGQLCLCEIKRDNDKKSRGYGFIRYLNYDDQKKVQGHMFMVEGRRVEVKKPKNNNTESTFGCSRVFVGQLDESVSKIELMDYFEQFGDINSCFYEPGKKNYAFVEFEDPEIARAVLREKSHFIKGKHVVIRTADPRNKNQQSSGASGGGGGDSGSSLPVRERLDWDDTKRGMGSAGGSLSSPYGQFGMPGSYSSYGYGDRGDLPAARQSNAMGGGGGFAGSEAMMSTMAKMMAEAVSQQLSQHLGSQNGQNSRSFYDSNGSRNQDSSSNDLDRARYMSR